MSLAIPVVSVRAGPQQAIRVMVVDDSVVVRGLVARWLAEEPGIKVVASLRTGREAVDQFDRFTPDVVLLDIEMPELDGLAALPLLLLKGLAPRATSRNQKPVAVSLRRPNSGAN